MARTTIDFGIDLGTTNSSVALVRGTEVDVIPNQEGAAFTPSAVWIDKKERLFTGRLAKEQLERDPDNTTAEFKLLMGLGKRGKKVFARSGREMVPEELSAEILKSLAADVRQQIGEELSAAVITVPAAFELPQCDATRRAAQVAGLQLSPLLQEPVAAALAYGFQKEEEKAFWLVYDFGGGTFDAAVVQLRDGLIQVVNHAGDNYLGGKLIDWDLVSKKIAPALAGEFSLPEFHRGNPRWRTAIATLKLAAERAKIQVCRTQSPDTIWIENLCQDDAGTTVEVDLEVTPAMVAEVAEPYVRRSINHCRQALEEKGLAPQHLQSVLLVGGTTLIPWLRDQVSAELGVPLEFGIDPMTVVTRGAAIFAETQKLPAPVPVAGRGAFRLELDYQPVGYDLDPPVGGRVVPPDGESLQGMTVEIIEEVGGWSSGRIALSESGAFLTDVHAERGRKNEYRVEVCDGSGARRDLVPDRFHYTVGIAISNPPLTHSVGVAMANNEMDAFVRKGTPLPARHTAIHRLARRCQGEDVINIPVVEGEHHHRADRNRLIGCLRIPASALRRELPADAEIEITIEIDDSRIVTTSAFIPILDESFEEVIKFEKAPKSASKLAAEHRQEQRRLQGLRAKASEVRDPRADSALGRIEEERMAEQVDSLLQEARGEPEAAQPCENRLLDLKAAIDEVEDALSWPSKVAEAEEALRDAAEVVSRWGGPTEQGRLEQLRAAVRAAIENKDPADLQRQITEVQALRSEVLHRRPEFWLALFQHLESLKGQMTDQASARGLFERGQAAVAQGDTHTLESVVRQLYGLLPADQQAEVGGFGGSTLRS